MVLCIALSLEEQVSIRRVRKSTRYYSVVIVLQDNTRHNHSPLLLVKKYVSWKQREDYKLPEVC